MLRIFAVYQDLVFVVLRFASPSIKGLKERPLKGPLGLYGGFVRPYKGYTRVI